MKFSKEFVGLLDVDSLLAQGNDLYKANNFPEALKFYNQVILLNPVNAEAYIQKAHILQRSNDLKGAIEVCNHILINLPFNINNIEAYIQIGHILQRSGDLNGAIEVCNHILINLPFNINNIEAYIQIGHILQSLGDLKGAVEVFYDVLKVAPNNIDAYFYRGSILERLGSLHSAIKVYDEVIEIDPHNAEAYHKKGSCLFVLTKHRAAEAYYQTAIDKKKEAPDIERLSQTIKSHHDAQQLKDIMGQCLGIVKNGGKDAEEILNAFYYFIQFNRAKYSGFPRITAKYLNYKKIIEVADNQEIVKTRILELLKTRKKEDSKDYDRVEKVFCDAIISIDENDLEANINKGICLSEQKPSQALKCFNKALQFDPNNPELHYQKARALEMMGEENWESAIECYDKAISFLYDEGKFLVGKAECLMKMKKFLDAISCYEQAIECGYKNATTLKEICQKNLDIYVNKLLGSALQIKKEIDEYSKQNDNAEVKVKPPNDSTIKLTVGEAKENCYKNLEKYCAKILKLKPCHQQSKELYDECNIFLYPKDRDYLQQEEPMIKKQQQFSSALRIDFNIQIDRDKDVCDVSENNCDEGGCVISGDGYYHP